MQAMQSSYRQTVYLESFISTYLTFSDECRSRSHYAMAKCDLYLHVSHGWLVQTVRKRIVGEFTVSPFDVLLRLILVIRIKM